LVGRLNGREGQADLDARWRTKVADVRNWFEFGAKERWRADNAEREFYRDSSGKSGGQKEKLAYTILAAALAYQFGLGDTQARQRHFRFVVIDEAFGRGSDDSTRYGLELFRSLDLQLLIVTPSRRNQRRYHPTPATSGLRPGVRPRHRHRKQNQLPCTPSKS
jgi:uncharacterized protein YPO0396